MKIAALLTCHNRCDKTITCIEAWHASAELAGIEHQIFVVDDGSTDGTYDAIRNAFPLAQLISGSGSLFWAGGMRKAFAAALAGNYDYYLWLNDDTFLYPEAIATLIRSEQASTDASGRPVLVVGTVKDPQTDQLTYGGRVSRGWKQPLFYDLVVPQISPVACDTMNGNCVLIPSEIARTVGNLDPVFTHGKADYDYGYRVRKAGYLLVVADAVVGECSRNDPENWEKLCNMTLVQRWRYLNGPKYYPLHEWWVYTRRHAGVFWLIHWLRPYFNIFY